MSRHSPPLKLHRPRIGLALGSGVARGWAHIGVLRALQRYGVVPDIISGTSIGAVVGGAFAAKKLDEIEAWALSMSKIKIASFLDFRVKSSGLIGGERLLQELDRYLQGITIQELGFPFLCIAADLNTGHEVWIRKGPLSEAMRASFSIPGVFPPYKLDDRWLVDGALVNPVPVTPLLAMGARMTIAVNLSADLIGKSRHRASSAPFFSSGDDLMGEDTTQSVPLPAGNSLARRLFRREANAPSLFNVMVSALNIIQDRLTRSRLAGDPPDVMIAPKVSHIGLFEFDRAEEMIAEGEASVLRALPDINDALTIFQDD